MEAFDNDLVCGSKQSKGVSSCSKKCDFVLDRFHAHDNMTLVYITLARIQPESKIC